MNQEEAIKTRPPGKEDHLLRERFYDAVAGQGDLMDRLAQTLLTVELAIPGLYATSLKLVTGKEGLTLTTPLSLAFVCWLMALVSLLYALIPKRYSVDPSKIRNSDASIETFFHQSAAHKWRYLLISILFFIAGIGNILWDIFQ